MAITAEDPTQRRRRARAGQVPDVNNVGGRLSNRRRTGQDPVQPHPMGNQPCGDQLAKPLRECHSMERATAEPSDESERPCPQGPPRFGLPRCGEPAGGCCSKHPHLGRMFPLFPEAAQGASEIFQIQKISMQSLHKSCAIPRYHAK